MQQSLRKFTGPLTWAVPLAVAALGVALARADNLDRALLRHAPAIMEDLRANGYTNVGVLKFRVQKGTAAPSMHAGFLNTSLATRLENALILAQDKAQPIGITRGASEAAAELDGKAS